MDINRVIDIVRFFKEEGEGGPTNVTGSATLGYDPNTETPPVHMGVGKNKKRRKYATGGRGSRKWWLQYLKGK